MKRIFFLPMLLLGTIMLFLVSCNGEQQPGVDSQELVDSTLIIELNLGEHTLMLTSYNGELANERDTEFSGDTLHFVTKSGEAVSLTSVTDSNDMKVRISVVNWSLDNGQYKALSHREYGLNGQLYWQLVRSYADSLTRATYEEAKQAYEAASKAYVEKAIQLNHVSIAQDKTYADGDLHAHDREGLLKNVAEMIFDRSGDGILLREGIAKAKLEMSIGLVITLHPADVATNPTSHGE